MFDFAPWFLVQLPYIVNYVGVNCDACCVGISFSMLFPFARIYLNLPFIYILFGLQQLVIYETSAAELDIIRDISRTFPSHVFFQQRHGPGQRSLYNVLKAYSVYDRDVGYVQVYFPTNLLHIICFCDMLANSILLTAGDGLFSWSVASLYEWRRCILVIGCITKRSCPCPHGRFIFGNFSFELYVDFIHVYFGLLIL